MADSAETLLLRPRDAARLLSVSESTLDRLRRRGEIRPLKVGAAVLYARSELERWVSEKMRKNVLQGKDRAE